MSEKFSKLKYLLKKHQRWFKLFFTLLAFFIIYQKVELNELKRVFQQANATGLFAAFLLFIFSQISSAIRAKIYYETVRIFLSFREVVKLYWIGMFYNIFLPGGIGGDGYKIFMLNAATGVQKRQLLKLTFLERLSGLVALFIMAGLTFLFTPLAYTTMRWLVIVALILAFPIFFLFKKYFFPIFLDKTIPTFFHSLLVQLLQGLASWCILKSLGEDGEMIYIFLFYLSSIAAVLPLTIGGLGARELLLVYAADFTTIDASLSFSLGFVVFCIVVLMSLFGAFFIYKPFTITAQAPSAKQ
ncbi:MAG: flippase-like domain-containing protein [Flammeovirgaceae bacterium]|nr:flippase-like domain-containing protein [Flammeovirgaceae bacterium]MDW8286473.1 lysylphosphatidylglycerol synthase transmembrane domain-containing protein [Flammeovirgaceae bacterium]